MFEGGTAQEPLSVRLEGQIHASFCGFLAWKLIRGDLQI